MLTYSVDFGAATAANDDAAAALLVVPSCSSSTTARFRMVSGSSTVAKLAETTNQNHCSSEPWTDNTATVLSHQRHLVNNHQQQQQQPGAMSSGRALTKNNNGEVEPLLPGVSCSLSSSSSLQSAVAGVTGQSQTSHHQHRHQQPHCSSSTQFHHPQHDSYNGANAAAMTVCTSAVGPGATAGSSTAATAANVLNINLDPVVTNHRLNGAMIGHQRTNSGQSISSTEEERTEGTLLLLDHGHGARAPMSRAPPPSQIPLRRCVLLNLMAFLFVSVSMIVNLLVISIIHERVPMEQPHLPDFAFDILPDHRHFLDIAEYVIVIQTFCIGVLLFFHRHRSTILRRICIIMAIIYFFRAVCMFPTQLSLASKHYICSPQLKNSSQYANMTSFEFVETIVSRVFYMSLGMGLSINGHHTFCGDYIFSGHTVILILSYLIQQEYLLPSRRRTLVWKCVDLIQFLMTATSVLCILIARGHYTIDIIIAYFVTTRVFWIYHTLCSLVSSSNINWPGNYLRRVWWWDIFLFLESIPTNNHQNGTPSTSSYHPHHHKEDYQELSPGTQANQAGKPTTTRRSRSGSRSIMNYNDGRRLNSQEKSWNDPPMFSMEQLNKASNTVPVSKRYRYPQQPVMPGAAAPGVTNMMMSQQSQQPTATYPNYGTAGPYPSQMAGPYPTAGQPYNSNGTAGYPGPTPAAAPHYPANSYAPGYGQAYPNPSQATSPPAPGFNPPMASDPGFAYNPQQQQMQQPQYQQYHHPGY